MESIKKQSLPSNPTANAAPAPAPTATATSQFPLSAHQDDTFVAPLVTLELSKQFGEWQQHLQHLPAPTKNSRWSPFSAYLSPSSCAFLWTQTDFTPLWPLLCLGPFVLGPAISAPSPASTPESMITSSCITNFLSNIFRRLPPWVKFICCHCSARQLKDLYTHTHTHTRRTQSKQSQPELPCQAELDELKLNNELSRQGNVFQFQQLIVEWSKR